MCVTKPLVSIIMPCFNASLFITKAIESVIQQTYSNWELIIVDDCSLDRSLEVIGNYDDNRISTYMLSVNSGSPACPRNLGIKKAKGDYIAFLDADDSWYPEKIELQLNRMLRKQADFSCTSYNLVKEGKVVSCYKPPKSATYDDLLINNSVGCLTAMVRSDFVKKHMFPVCGHEDFALWLKVIKDCGYVLGIQECLANYNVVEGSVSSSKHKLIPYFWHIYRNEENMSIADSLYYCARYFFNVVFFKYR
ncbi:glycosyltransferase family 2 protein [Aliivibrio fischeri]|uniref:glycosyltransferase family 2 protein n=1 Tax=Aliivibrio fischeri TaxID=668 RepID=UPI0037358B61